MTDRLTAAVLMTPAQVDDANAKRLQSFSSFDVEHGHQAADAVLCDLLRQLGFAKTAAAFESLEKWYA